MNRGAVAACGSKKENPLARGVGTNQARGVWRPCTRWVYVTLPDFTYLPRRSFSNSHNPARYEAKATVANTQPTISTSANKHHPP